MRVKEAARWCSSSVTTIRRLIARGELPGYRLGGTDTGPILIDVADLDELVTANPVEAL